jgi:hypothetical protein
VPCQFEICPSVLQVTHCQATRSSSVMKVSTARRSRLRHLKDNGQAVSSGLPAMSGNPYYAAGDIRSSVLLGRGAGRLIRGLCMLHLVTGLLIDSMSTAYFTPSRTVVSRDPGQGFALMPDSVSREAGQSCS